MACLLLLAVAAFLAAMWWRERRRRLGAAERVARAAHELRGPLAAAHLALASLARETAAPRGRCAAVDLQLQRAGLALGDLAAAPGGGRCRDVPGTVDVAALLEEQASAFRPMAVAHGCELLLAPAPAGAVVVGDRLRLAQALGNVIANAVEHGAGRIQLSARASGGRVRVEIVDEGPGLPAPVAELAARARAGRGHRGRGLAIAADIARRHGGRLAAAPSEGGARLALELPAARRAVRARAGS